MSKRLGLVVAVLIAATALASNDRQLDLTRFIHLLNGAPSYLGTIYGNDGGTYTNATTMCLDGGTGNPADGGFVWVTDGGAITPSTCSLDAGAGNVVMVECNGLYPQFIYSGSNDKMTATNGVQVAPATPYYMTLAGTDAVIAIAPTPDAGTQTGPCNVYRMR